MVRQPAERRRRPHLTAAIAAAAKSSPPDHTLPPPPPPPPPRAPHIPRSRPPAPPPPSRLASQGIFLRELISNAADACDKKRFLSLTEEGASFYEGRVRLVADKEANTLTIEDNGIGMSLADLKNNLGKIAQSGAPAGMG